ncbi:hypothetical protein ACNC73_003912, partial [Escherichia coli]
VKKRGAHQPAPRSKQYCENTSYTNRYLHGYVCGNTDADQIASLRQEFSDFTGILKKGLSASPNPKSIVSNTMIKLHMTMQKQIAT